MAKAAVGLLLFTELPPGELVALLHVRGRLNPEKPDWRESWAGGCQVTCHGGLEEGEEYIDALDREVKEELGSRMAYLCQQLKDQNRMSLVNDDDGVRTYAAFVEREILACNLGYALSTMRHITEKELDEVQNLKEYPKDGTVPSDVIAMHADELEALRKAFQLFKS